MVLDKPSGLLVIPTPRGETRTLTSILNDDLAQRGLATNLHPCHRLDRETSGLIIYAKGKSNQKLMMDLFKIRKVHKKYIAFVSGALSKASGTINLPIEEQDAQTVYRVLEKRNGFSIVEVRPTTGRTNQIRIHFKYLCHPILGDTKYAFRRDFAIKAKRLCLHAQELDFVHPVSGKQIHLHVKLPADLQKFLDTH